ncbi:Bug family tripartite tricarboxylate transporter substrate binding protein [Bordetella muralis]|jgi:tripartite-type tricarboxylate transporter receptor subunit TctC|uniref:Bug family tripartite tricarboxylate transporter substrate binding protein n=1 Tax=Bordetella muralis TaxID=1649130 RepID=UPI0039EFE188
MRFTKWAMLACLSLGVAAQAAAANEYPSRSVHLVVPFPAGSTTDAMARFLGERVAKALGQSVIVENKAGAQGSIAASEVSRAAADGYTLLVGTNSTQSANVHLFKKLPYDPARDFAAITQFTMNPLILVVRPDLPAQDVEQFLAYAKANPGKLNYGTGNTGSLAAAQMLKSMAGIQAMEVPYAGTPQAITDLLAGRLDFMITDISVTRPYIEAGKLRALAVTPRERVVSLPDIPTFAEAGLPDYEFVAWGGLFAPSGTPAPVVDRLNQVFVQALQSDEAAAFFAKQGQQAAPRTPQDFADYVVAQTDLWGELLAAAGQKKQ